MTVLKVVFVLMLALTLVAATASIQVADSTSPPSSLSLVENNPTPYLRVDFTQASGLSSSSSSSGSSATTPLRVDIVDTNTMREVTPPSTFRPESMGERSSFGANEQDPNAQLPIDAAVYAFLGVVALVLAVAGAVLYKKCKTSSSQESLGKGYRSYCPSPFDSARRVSQQQDDDLYASVKFNASQRATPAAITAFSGENDDELSNSYRTCSRVYSERISSEFSSLVAISSRSSSSIESDIDDDAGTVVSKMTTVAVVPVSALQKQRMDRSVMAEFEDSFVESDDEEHERTRGVTKSSCASSELYASFVESEARSASEVSWSRDSSWSGSEVSSLDSARATDVTLWSSSSSRSMSFRISDVYSEQPDDHDAEEHEQEQNHGAKDNGTRLPTPTAIAAAATPPVAVVTASRCDSILLFKPIKPMRLLAPKRKTPLPPTAREHASTGEERQELQRIFDL